MQKFGIIMDFIMMRLVEVNKSITCFNGREKFVFTVLFLFL